MDDLATRLARKWCAYCTGEGDRSPDAHHYHGATAAAIREALEEAEKIAREHPHCHAEPREEKATGCAYAIGDDIAALRGRTA